MTSNFWTSHKGAVLIIAVLLVFLPMSIFSVRGQNELPGKAPSDSTAFNTDEAFLVKDINPIKASASLSPEELVDVNGTLYFTADDWQHSQELWKSDGTEAGTTLVRDINPAGNANPIELFVAAGGLYFSAYDGESGRELWRTDCTEPGTMLVQDIADDLYTSSSPGLNVFNGSHLLFRATDSEHGAEL
jgi:ELWxxDGT repeat protein